MMSTTTMGEFAKRAGLCLIALTAACFTQAETLNTERPRSGGLSDPVCEPSAIVFDSQLLNNRSLAEALRDYEGWWPAETRAYPVPLAYPDITNMKDVRQAMVNALPTGLSDNPVSGTPIFALLIGVDGAIQNWKLIKRSGQPGIDQAAARALTVARFNPMLAPSGCRAMHLVRVPLNFSS